MSKCVCHINGYAIKDATAREELETLKNEVETLKTTGGGSGAVEAKKEAYINIENAIQHHNSAIPMLCLQTPYYNNTIVGGTLWDTNNGDPVHFTLLNSVKLESGKSINLTFSYGPGLFYIHLNNLTVTEVNGIYYWHTQDITVTDATGNTMDMYGSSAMICSLLLHSTEA